MRKNETLITCPGSPESGGYRVRIYDSEADFRHREFFEHRHSDFELSVILQGRGLYRLADGVHEFGQGDIMIFGSDRVHCVTDVLSEEPMILFDVQLEPRLIWSPYSALFPREALALFNDKCEILSPECPVHAIVRERLDKIREEALAKQTGYPTMIKACLCEIFTVLMRWYGITDRPDSGAGVSKRLFGMEKAMNYINENLSSPLTLEELAGVAGFSRTYFSALFSSLNGLSPWEYINIRRIERSRALLRDTDLSVLEIAGTCGYATLPNFNRLFIRGTGMTPTAYRASCREGKS